MYNRYVNGKPTEISLTTVKEFYRQNEHLFDTAVDAVVRGCVNKYYFDQQNWKFIGSVSSLQGNEMNKVEITLTDKFGIKLASCECTENGMCYHVGALALNSGYDTPIFSYQNTTDGIASSDESDDFATQPFHEVFIKSEILDSIEAASKQTLNINSKENSSSSSSNMPLDGCKIKSEIAVKEEQNTSDQIRLQHTQDKKTTDDCEKLDHTCELCDKTFDSTLLFEVHQRYGHRRELHKMRMFQCAICSSRKKNKHDLESHMRKAHQNKECSLCGLFFLTHASKSEHLRKIHFNNKTFRCTICSRSFCTKEDLDVHRSNHQRSQCPVCEKMFNRTGHYNRHLRAVHRLEPTKRDSELKYKCSRCSECFPNFALFDKHLRSHTKVSVTFPCSRCDKTFDTKKGLTSHEIGHRSRLHECKSCDKVFHRESDLSRHCREEHLERHECKSCNEVFHRESHLYRHCREAHIQPVNQATESSLQYERENLLE